MIDPKDYTAIDSLLKVMAQLRNPDGGCPWDLEQDFSTIAPYTLEEAYEVADAIERNDMADLCEELGDLLLQVVFHAQIASEEDHFDFGHVVSGIVDKMIRRHPHVFGNETRNSAGEVVTRWDEIKAAEKEAKRGQHPGLLDDVPANLPGLMQAAKIGRKASKVGFDWPDHTGALAKVGEEIEELTSAINEGNQTHIQAEMGDLLFTCANLSRHLGVDADAALRQANQKFRDRFARMEHAVPAENMLAKSPAELDALWEDAKSGA